MELGGECHWAGCIPTKAMVRAADVWHLVRHAAEFGIEAEIRKADFAAAMAYKSRKQRETAGDGPEDAGLSKLGAAYFPVRATFEGPNEVRVGESVIRGRRIILATGTAPAIPSLPGLADVGFITNREAVNLETLPKRLIVLGAGPIGLEFAQIFRRFGAEVTIIEKGPQILPREDTEIASLAAQYLREEGIQILTDTSVVCVQRTGASKQVIVQTPNGSKDITADEILLAAGRKAAIEGMNIEATGLIRSGDFLPVDPFLRTAVPHILAPGDVSGTYLFTHVASYEGRIAAHNAFGDNLEEVNYRVIPRVTFLDPEVASVGLTEEEALTLHKRIAVHTFAFADLDRAILHGDTRGMVKLIADERDEQLLGAHLIGPYASSLLAELAVVMQNNLPIRAIAATMHAFPSFPEAVEAAALTPPVYRNL